MGKAVLIGGGESANRFDLSLLENFDADVVGINKSVFELPFRPDILFTADKFFHSRYTDQVRDFSNSGGKVVFCYPKGSEIPDLPDSESIERLPGIGVTTDLRSAYFGDNSGYAALNWAVLRYDTVFLIGYDFSPGHWHGGYSYSIAERYPNRYRTWAENFNLMGNRFRRQAEVFNLNKESAVCSFPVKKYEDMINGR